MLRQLFSPAVAAVVLLTLGHAAYGERSDENATRSADDAFGTSIGNESVGLYRESEVRGFDPAKAGNVRIEGLYFDQQGGLNWRVQEQSSVRVGLTSQGYAFPAPTGIIDYQLRKPQGDAGLSMALGYGPYGGTFGELDGRIALNEKFAIGGGISHYDDEYEDGGGSRYEEIAVLPRWHDAKRGIDVVGFWSRSRWNDTHNSPVISMSGNYLPPEIKRNRYFGQPWAAAEAVEDNYGVAGTLQLASNWTARLGLFRSESKTVRDFANILVDVQTDGLGESVMFADPVQSGGTWSGELRLTKLFANEHVEQSLDLAVRGRHKDIKYGGSAFADLGVIEVGSYEPQPEPDFVFQPRSGDRVRQLAGGTAYRARWLSLGEISVGLQRVAYRKNTRTDLGDSDIDENVWLYNGSVATDAERSLAFFASVARGLEESGTAPDIALNRNELLPAAITRQYDLGIRWRLTSDMRWVVTWFDLRKPYATVDENNVFRFLGKETHRGIETSLAGSISKRVTLLVGGMFADPRVKGGHDLISTKPVGQARRVIKGSVDYALLLCDCSVDAKLSHRGRVVASLDGDLHAPSFTTIDLGLRYRATIMGKPMLVRGQVTNITNEYGWQVISSRSFTYTPGRSFAVSFTVDI